MLKKCISATGKQIVVMGDFNINLLHFHASPHSQNFILSLQSHNLTLIIIAGICSGNIVSDLTAISLFCILNSSTNRDFHDQLKLTGMSFSRNGVRMWNSLSNEFRQMPKTKFTMCSFRNSRRQLNKLIYQI